MVAGDSRLGPGAIVVGGRDVDFVKAALALAREYELEVTRCDDVYTAVAQLAQGAGRSLMVIGRLGELAQENGRLFALAEASGAQCCCLWDQAVAGERVNILAAVRAGSRLAGGPGEMRAALEDWLINVGRPARNPADDDLTSHDLRATPEELSALLEQGTDE